MRTRKAVLVFIFMFVFLAVGCAGSKPYPDTPEFRVVLDVHKTLRRQFVYRETMQDAQSYADEILAGKMVVGVCRHYAPTAADLLQRRGIKVEMWMIERGGTYHMVALALDEWVLDGAVGLWPKSQYNNWNWVAQYFLNS